LMTGTFAQLICGSIVPASVYRGSTRSRSCAGGVHAHCLEHLSVLVLPRRRAHEEALVRQIREPLTQLLPVEWRRVHGRGTP
jgi:hypothetical protein